MGSSFCVFCPVILSAMLVAEERGRCGGEENAAWKRREDDMVEGKIM